MKKTLLSAIAFLAAMSVNAQEVCSFDSEALGLNSDGVALTAGTVIGQTESIICTVGADDTYKPQSVQATVGGQEISGGLQGNSNPKDADGGTPSGTLVAPVSGAYLQFEAKANGFLYVIHKASSNKAYTVFEEGEAIGYTYAAIGDAETDLGAVYQYTLQGAGEYNYLKDAGLTKVDWAEQEYLKSIGKYDTHVTTNDDGTTGWANIAKGGIGVIKFAVYEGCKYIVNANGSKITAGGFFFDTTGNAAVVSGDVTILAGEGGATPTPAPTGDGEIAIFNADNALNLDSDAGTALTAGTVIAETENIVAKVGADDTYKPQSVQATVNGQEINGGLQGSSNPKDADGGTPSGTLIAPVSGAYLEFEAKANGFLYVIHKASSNKAYTVFEEGEAIGYTYAAIGDAETDLGAVYQFTLQGAGEFNYLKDAGLTKVEWAEQEYLKSIGKYDTHVTTNDDGTTGWANISKGGIGVIKFAVYEGCKYIVNANGSKITAGGFYFDTTGDATVVAGDVTILSAGTGIRAAKVINIDNYTIYNLAGQKVDASYKGIVIKGGKKMIQK